MSAKHSIIVKTDTLTLSKAPFDRGDNRGFWLYDKTRGMNLAMRAESEQAAFIEAIKYYQNKLLETEKQLRNLQSKVEMFVSQFVENDNQE